MMFSNMKKWCGSALLRLAFSFMLYVMALATINDDIRKFVRVTTEMELLGAQVATSLSSKGDSSGLGLLLCMKPSSLVLVPEELQISPQRLLDRGTHSTNLVILPSKIQALKIVCPNKAVQGKFQEWGLIELCKKEAQITFSKYLNSVFEKKSHVAISKGDIESAPIVELGVLRCMKRYGPCTTDKPSHEKLASVLASQANT